MSDSEVEPQDAAGGESGAAESITTKAQAKKFSPASLAAAELDADILLINAPIAPGLDAKIRAVLSSREAKRDKIVVILVSAGGVADDAYRSAMAIRSQYQHVTMCISGWCKSAGTLMAIGADELIFGCNGEMGPLDVQIAVKDELVDNRDSGLILDAAIKGLTSNAFRVFESFMTSIISNSQGAITFRTAADLAADVTIGLMAPIYEKIDPLRMGADQRAQNIGMHYALRLNMKADNLRGMEALNMLLDGYPSHGFVIDIEEAQMLFTNVKALEGHLEKTIGGLGSAVRFPLDESLVMFLDGDDDDGEDVEEVGLTPQQPDAELRPTEDAAPHAAAEDLPGAVQAIA